MAKRMARISIATQATEMVGSGPFRFHADERMAGQLAEYEKFSGYVPSIEPPVFVAGGQDGQG